MSSLVGIVATSNKENELRLPIHPEHLERIPAELRPRLRFEEGYGEPFGFSTEELARAGGGIMERSELLASCALVILPKPMPKDLRGLGEGATLWGWPHCVQQREITQIAIDRRLTLIAFEAMFYWPRSGGRGTHVFSRNNELAGYASVLHALELRGLDGHYGRRRRAAVLGFGAVGRGAIHALRGRGFDEIAVYTQRPVHLVENRIFGCEHRRMARRGDGSGADVVSPEGARLPLADELGECALIVNATLQDPDRPLMYFSEAELPKLRRGSLIVDVSCDEGMGFPFARPTGFEDPVFEVEGVTYYGVDHSPSYLWDAATWEISDALLPYFETVLGGPEHWTENETVKRSIEIREGVIENPKILSFQDREEAYPHALRA